MIKMCDIKLMFAALVCIGLHRLYSQLRLIIINYYLLLNVLIITITKMKKKTTASLVVENSRKNVLFVTYTIIQSITSSEMCSLHLTHPSAHTPGAVGSQHCGSRGEVWEFSALLKFLTSVVDNSCRSRDSNPQPRFNKQCHLSYSASL